MSRQYTIPPCSGMAIEAMQGERITVIDADGGQVADFFAEAVDAGFRGVGVFCNGRNGAGYNAVGIVNDILCNLIFADSQALLHRYNFCNNGGDHRYSPFLGI